MAMMYDIALALKGARTDGQSKSAAGGATDAVTVRHGTVQSVSGGWAQVVLDGSEDPISVACEATPVPNQRVTVVRQGAVYKVISLGEIQTTISTVQSDVASVQSDVSTINTTVTEHTGQITTAYSRLDTNEAAIAQNQKLLEAAQASIKSNEQAIADEVSARQTAIDDARKVAENFIAQDSTGALTIADMSKAADARNSVVIDSYGMRVRESGEDVATFGEVCTLGKTSEFHSTVSQAGTQFLDAAGNVIGSIAEYIPGDTVLGVQITTDNTRRLTMSVPSTTAPDEISNVVEVTSNGVMIGRNEAYAYCGYSGTNAVATVTATNDITLTSGGGSIKANAYGGGLKCNTAAGLFEMSTTKTAGVTAAAGAALETSAGTIGLVSYPSSSTTNGAKLYLKNAGTAQLVVAPTGGVRSEVSITGNKITVGCTSGVIANDSSSIPSATYTACRLLSFGPIRILTLIGQSIGSTAWSAGAHTLFTLGQYHRPALNMSNTIMAGSAVCRIEITTAGLVRVNCNSTIAASTKMYGELVWIATA